MVADPADAPVPGVPVELKTTATGVALTTATGADGIFRFTSLIPATYDLTIKSAAGFKTYTQSNIEVTANEVRDLGRISLSLGAVAENVTVSAVATPVQTGSSENSKLIDQYQMSNVTLKGRDLLGLLVTLPGLAVTQRETTSENTIGSVRINGAVYASANFTVAGITNLDTGSNETSPLEPNMESIDEKRVLNSHHQAENSRNANSIITIDTKNGMR